MCTSPFYKKTRLSNWAALSISSNYAILLIALVKRDTFLEAVFL
jgi:hypothetical protein